MGRSQFLNRLLTWAISSIRNSSVVIGKKSSIKKDRSFGISCRSFKSYKFGELVPRCSRPLPAPRYHAKYGRRLKSKESKLNVFCFSWSACLLSELFILRRRWEVSLIVMLYDIDCNCQSFRLCPYIQHIGLCFIQFTGDCKWTCIFLHFNRGCWFLYQLCVDLEFYIALIRN